MSNSKKKVLVIEFSSWHDECLYTTCALFKEQNYNVTLFLNEDLKGRISESLTETAYGIEYFPFKKGIKGIMAVMKVYWLLLLDGYTFFYLNTAQGSVVWKLFLLPFPKRIKIIGTLHNIGKLKSSIGQKLITKRINGYVLLSDILLENYKRVCSKTVTSIYPILHPDSEKKTVCQKKEGDIWVVIPGAVSFSRRDYLSLFPKNVKYSSKIKFIILGNKNKSDGGKIFKIVNELNLEQNFIFFDEFVPNDVFNYYITNCDYIMPLIHPNSPLYNKYITEKISGTYNIAFANRKIMLCPTEFEVFEDFHDTSLFYATEELNSFINGLINVQISDAKFYNLKKWDKETLLVRMKNFLHEL